MIIQARAMAPELEHSTYSEANSSLQATISEIEENNLVPWIKDHALYSIQPEIVLSSLRSDNSVEEMLAVYANPTLIDDALLETFTPIFLIRHPILVVSSYYEVNLQSIGADVQDEQFVWMTSVRWVRMLFDFYRNRGYGQPIVVDAEDVVHRSVDVTNAICNRFGLDPDGVSLQWEAEPLTDKPGEFFKKRLRGSRGVEKEGDRVSPDANTGIYILVHQNY